MSVRGAPATANPRGRPPLVKGMLPHRQRPVKSRLDPASPEESWSLLLTSVLLRHVD